MGQIAHHVVKRAGEGFARRRGRGFDATIGIAHLKVPSTEVMDLIKSYHAAYGTAQS